MVARMVHIKKTQRVTINGIQSTYYNQAKYIYRQKEVYPMGCITQINIDPIE